MLLMTRREEVTPFAGECQEIFVASILTLHAGNAVVQITPVSGTRQAASR